MAWVTAWLQTIRRRTTAFCVMLACLMMDLSSYCAKARDVRFV